MARGDEVRAPRWQPSGAATRWVVDGNMSFEMRCNKWQAAEDGRGCGRRAEVRRWDALMEEVPVGLTAAVPEGLMEEGLTAAAATAVVYLQIISDVEDDRAGRGPQADPPPAHRVAHLTQCA